MNPLGTQGKQEGMTRRGFLGLLAGSIAAATSGITLAPAKSDNKRLHARHLFAYNLAADMWEHRIDMRYGDLHSGVDLLTQHSTLDAKYELAPALATLNKFMGRDGVEVGEIHTYSMAGWLSNPEAQARWNQLT